MVNMAGQSDQWQTHLFQQLIVLHVLLGSLVGVISLSLKARCGSGRRRQLVYQGHHSLHDTAEQLAG